MRAKAHAVASSRRDMYFRFPDRLAPTLHPHRVISVLSASLLLRIHVLYGNPMPQLSERSSSDLAFAIAGWEADYLPSERPSDAEHALSFDEAILPLTALAMHSQPLPCRS